MIKDKIIDINEIESLCNLQRKYNKKIITTNGCFDIVHSGHALFLEKCKSYGDFLIVGINSDESTKLIKGENRPINNQNERATIIASMQAVDAVTIFSQTDPIDFLNKVKPHFHIKGGNDYLNKQLLESSTVEKYGGKIIVIPSLGGSSTNIIQRILDLHPNGKADKKVQDIGYLK